MGKKLTSEQQGDLEAQLLVITNQDLDDLRDAIIYKGDVDEMVNFAHEAQEKLNQLVTRLEDIAND